jgi:predicted MPP superfamily phosphohydrolase
MFRGTLCAVLIEEVPAGKIVRWWRSLAMAEVEHLELSVERLPEAFSGLRILHLSDLHITRWTAELDQWRGQIATLSPDVAVITGDLGHRSWKWKKTLPNVQKLLSGIHAPLGIYFILGNHDSPDLGPALAASGPTLLANESVIVEKSGQRLAIIGVAQHRRSDTDIPAALQNVRPDDFKLMLLHYPDLIHAAAAAGVDVCLAGHTHGGQICLPDGTPIIGHDVLPPNMCTGLSRIADTWLVVNRGIGKAGLRLRLFCPPQIMMLTLRTNHHASEGVAFATPVA